MLGVRWSAADRTQDIDFARAARKVSVLLPGNLEVQVHDAIASLDMGFLPVSGLASRVGASYLNPREPDFRLDFVTTAHRGAEAPIRNEQLNVTMQPLKFMEYLLEDIQQAALFCVEGAVLVNVPHPARYALHKLLVHGERAGTFRAKAGKDLMQVASLLAALQNRPEELALAWRDLVGRGRAWQSRAVNGLAALRSSHTDVAPLNEFAKT
jgi:hypothetical protein